MDIAHSRSGNLSEMIGGVFTAVSETNHPAKSNWMDMMLSFHREDGTVFVFGHYQDCCESVSLEDINGDLSDLVGTPLLVAEERSHHKEDTRNIESETWTFYTFRTIKGSVDVRFYGTSNGYYSESVDLIVVEA